jgi:predicted nucleic acid-binding protein
LAGSAVFTDALKSYEGLDEFQHEVVDHAVEYVRGEVHTNGLESFWSLLKRGIHGTYVSVEPFHLFRHLDEQAFRYNNSLYPYSESLVREAMDHGCHTGISGIDALHIACAVFAGAEEFITTEKRAKPIHRTRLIRVTCIRPEEDKR